MVSCLRKNAEMTPTPLHLLLLEDDIDLGQAVVDHLEAHGHTVDWMKLCSQADRFLQQNADIQLALLDLRLPDGDGLTVLSDMRARGDTRPVLILTARDQISDRVHGLQAGADDYLVKPFDLDELLARIHALARRLHFVHQSPNTCALKGDVVLDFHHKIAKRNDELIALTAMEWTVMNCLAKRIGKVWSRGELEDVLYQNTGAEPESNSLEVLISRLRRKLGAECITTHRGIGYRLER